MAQKRNKCDNHSATALFGALLESMHCLFAGHKELLELMRASCTILSSALYGTISAAHLRSFNVLSHGFNSDVGICKVCLKLQTAEFMNVFTFCKGGCSGNRV